MRCQVGIEYLIIMGILLAMLVPLMVYVTEVIRMESETHQAQTAADRIASAIDHVSAQGYPSRKTVDILLPESATQGSGATNYTVVVKLQLSGQTISDIVSYTKTSCAFGAIPNRSGFYTVQVMAQQNNCVQVFVNVTQPPQPPQDTTPPIISSVQHNPTNPVSNQTVYVSWNTDENANSTVSRRINLGAWTNITSGTYSVNHNMSIGSFTAGNQVQYYVTSCDPSNNCAMNNNGGSYYSFTVSGTGITDYSTWKLMFDPASDFNYKQTGTWTIKVWLYNQTAALQAGKILRLTVTRITGGGGTAVNNQLMTDNGNGSYQYNATIPGSWNNDWAQIRIFYDDPNNNLDMNYYRVAFVRSFAGSNNRPWKIELDSTSNTTSVLSNQNFTVKAWLYNAQNATMAGENVRITVQSENGPVVINNLAMTNNGNGSYQYTITNGTLTTGTDYRIQTTITKSISGRNYRAEYQYTVESV